MVQLVNTLELDTTKESHKNAVTVSSSPLLAAFLFDHIREGPLANCRCTRVFPGPAWFPLVIKLAAVM